MIAGLIKSIMSVAALEGIASLTHSQARGIVRNDRSGNHIN